MLNNEVIKEVFVLFSEKDPTVINGISIILDNGEALHVQGEAVEVFVENTLTKEMMKLSIDPDKIEEGEAP